MDRLKPHVGGPEVVPAVPSPRSRPPRTPASSPASPRGSSLEGRHVAGEKRKNPPTGLAENPPLPTHKKSGRYFIVPASLFLS